MFREEELIYRHFKETRELMNDKGVVDTFPFQATNIPGGKAQLGSKIHLNKVAHIH